MPWSLPIRTLNPRAMTTVVGDPYPEMLLQHHRSFLHFYAFLDLGQALGDVLPVDDGVCACQTVMPWWMNDQSRDMLPEK